MADTAADILIETLHDWGVEVVFGLPGDGINAIMEALRRHQDRIRFFHFGLQFARQIVKLLDIFLNFLLIRRQDQLGIELGHMRIIFLFLLLFGILRALGA